MTSERELGVHRSSTSSRVGSHGFDCRSRALSWVEGWKNKGYELPGTVTLVTKLFVVNKCLCNEVDYQNKVEPKHFTWTFI